MTNRRLPWTLLVLGTVLAAPTLWSGAQDSISSSINWRTDYNAARKEAFDKNLPLLINFGTKVCYYCKLLEDRTFPDGRVKTVMNEKFVPLKLDANVEHVLASNLQIDRYPTIVLAAPDGKILDTLVGFKDPDPFHEQLQRTLASITSPDWMLRDFQLAQKWHQAGDYPRTLGALKTILEDGKSRPVQVNAMNLLKDIEAKASDRLQKARELQGKGMTTEAIELLSDTIRVYAGTHSSKEASELLAKAAQNTDVRTQQRVKRARDLLAQARDFHKNREYLPCLDRCELLIGTYGDLPEGQEAQALIAEIRANPEELQKAAATLSDRLGGLYLALADALLKKGQRQPAEFYLQRVIVAFPGSRQAESAQIRLGQLQGTPASRVEFQAAGN